MAVTIRNIIVGAGNLYVAPAGTALPEFRSGEAFNTTMTSTRVDDTTTTAVNEAGGATLGWRHVGGTQEGVEVAYEPDYGEVELDQLKDAALLFNQGIGVSLNTTMAEATLENLVLAWGMATGSIVTDTVVDTETLWLGVPDDNPVERRVVVVGKAPTTAAGAPRDRVYMANRVISVDASSHALRRTEATTFPVSFRLLPDPAQPAGREYGRIVDRSVTPT